MFGDRLRYFRRERGLTQQDVAHRLGITAQAVGKWEMGASSPDPATIAHLAEILEISADELLSLPGNAYPVGEPGRYADRRVAVVGAVKAGYNAFAFEEDYGYEYANVKNASEYFYLVVKGDSMEPRIYDGDLALVHRQPTLENGDLGVILYGAEGEGTLKKFIRRGNAVILRPFNPDYKDLVIKGADLEHLHIVGKVVETKTQW